MTDTESMQQATTRLEQFRGGAMSRLDGLRRDLVAGGT